MTGEWATTIISLQFILMIPGQNLHTNTNTNTITNTNTTANTNRNTNTHDKRVGDHHHQIQAASVHPRQNHHTSKYGQYVKLGTLCEKVLTFSVIYINM